MGDIDFRRNSLWDVLFRRNSQSAYEASECSIRDTHLGLHVTLIKRIME